MKLKNLFLLTSFLLLSAFGYSSEETGSETVIRQFRADHKVITVKVSQTKVSFNDTPKTIPSGAIDLKQIPADPSDKDCMPDNRWLVTQGASKREYCKNQKAIQALQKLFTQVKVITR